MLRIVLHLFCTAPIGFVNRLLHGIRYLVGVHNHFAVDITCRTSRGLSKTSVIAQESFFVRVEYGNQAYLRQIKTFAQQIHAYQNIIFPFAQIFQNPYAFKSVDVAVDIC